MSTEMFGVQFYKLPCQREAGNISDPFAVSVLKDGVIVGHVTAALASLVVAGEREVERGPLGLRTPGACFLKKR